MLPLILSMNGFQWMCAKLLPELRETAKERQNMKTVSITTIAAVLLVGCATMLPPDYSLSDAIKKGFFGEFSGWVGGSEEHLG